MKRNSRSLARYLSVQAVYQQIEASLDYDQVFNDFSDYYFDDVRIGFDDTIDRGELKVDKVYFSKIFENQNSKKKLILSLIKKNLKNDWSIDTLPIVLKSILIVAISEMIISPDLPIGVITTEYIILTETFFVENESSFVNAFIEKVYQQLKKDV